jgi:MATE family multidrug resistance protein
MNREILRLAIPNIISGITIPLLGAVSLAMMGRLDDIVYMGALSVGSMMFNFLYWCFSFLRMGTTGFTAQAFGRASRDGQLPRSEREARDVEERPNETVEILARGLFIALSIAVLILIFQQPILKLATVLIHPEESLMQVVSSYFYIRIWAAPTVICFYVFGGWLIGMQDTKTLMWVSVVINLLNVFFNWLFIFALEMRNADGAAIGTVCAQYCGFIISLLVLQIKYRAISKFFTRAVIKAVGDWRKLRRFLSVNSDIFLRTLCFIFVFSFFTAESAHHSQHLLVLNMLLYQFYIFFSYACDGFAHAAEALSGRFTGSGDLAMKKRSIKYSFTWGAGITAMFLVAYALFYHNILQMFTTDASVIALSKDYYYWVLIVTLVGMPAFLWDGVFAGSLATKPLVYTMIIASSTFFGSYYGFVGLFGNHALWIALTLFLVMRGLCLTLWSKKVIS